MRAIKLERSTPIPPVTTQPRFWKLAPLIDVPVPREKMLEANFKTKIFFAGGVATGVAKTVSSPLTRLIILLQTQQFSGIPSTPKPITATHLARVIYRKQGLIGFFRGNGIDISRSFVYGGVNYLLFEKLKQLLLPYDSSKSGVYGRMVAGGLSGVASVLLLYPLDLLRTRIAVKSEIKLATEVKNIMKTEGISSFYRGLSVSCLQIFPHLAINFAVFDILKNYLCSFGYEGIFLSLASGSVAGAVASVSTFPLDVVIRNLQLDGQTYKIYRNAWHCAQVIVRQHGFKGLYAGLLLQLVKCVPIAATSFAIYDRMKKWLELQ